MNFWKKVFEYCFIPKLYIFGKIFGGGSSRVRTASPTQLLQQQNAANRLNVFTPTSSAVFGGEPTAQGLPSELTITDSPEVAALRQASQRALLGSFGDLEGFGQIDLSGLGELPTRGDFNLDANRLSQEFFDQQLSFLNPEFERRDERLAQTLANQGLVQGSTGFGERTGIENEEQLQALTRAGRDAALFGESIRGQRLGQDLALRQQGLQEIFGPRQQAISEIAAMLGTQQALQGQTLNPSVPQLDVLGAHNLRMQADLQNAANRASAASAGFGALGTLGAGFLGGPAFGAGGIFGA